MEALKPTIRNVGIAPNDDDSSSSDDYQITQHTGDTENENNENFAEPTNIPSLDEQEKIIKELKKTNILVAGEKVYALSSSWYSKWETATRNHFDSISSFCYQKIDNSDIYDPKHDCLNYSKSESKDYILVNKAIWDKLNEWYPGGPEIKIDVVMGPSKYPIAKVKKVLVVAKYKDQNKEVYIDKNDTVHDVKKQFLDMFEIKTQDPKTVEDSSSFDILDEEDEKEKTNEIKDEKAEEEKSELENEELPAFEDFRILDNYGGTNIKLEEDRKIGQCNIITNNPIILDYKENGKWTNELRTSIRTTTSSATSYYGYSSTRDYGPAAGPGKVGLMNLGNTCFFNSGTQCLLHTKPLVKALLSPDWSHDINRTNPLGMHGKLAEAFQELLTRVWSGTQSVLDPSRLKSTIGQFNSTFSGWGQQDSHEYITFLLDGIHEDLNRCIEKPLTDAVIGDGTNDEETAKRAWETHKMRNNSIITDIFQGQFRSKLVCPKCHRVTVVFDPYTAVSLPITRPQVRSLSITFVPYDYLEKPFTVSVVVGVNAGAKEIDEALSAKIGRPVRTQVASSQYNGLSWGLVESSYSSAAYFAFETPNEEEAYIACVVRLRMVNPSYPDYPQDKEGSPIFLVGVPREIVTKKSDSLSDEEKKEAAERAEAALLEGLSKKLGCLWSGIEETEKSLKFAENVKPNEKDPESKFGVVIESPSSDNYYYYRAQNIPSYLVFPRSTDRVTKNIAYVQIGDEYRTKESGFSYEALIRNRSHMRGSSNGADNGAVTLEDCFRFFSTEETLDEQNEWFCPHCREHVCATKKMELWKVPQILIIHLKRFSGVGYHMHKNERLVQYPDEIDISEFVVGPHSLGTRYRLYGVSEHMGSMMGGHYTAHAVVSELGKSTGVWYSFNDSSANVASASSAHNGSAYLLFYQRIDEECPTIEGASRSGSVQLNQSTDSDDCL